MAKKRKKKKAWYPAGRCLQFSCNIKDRAGNIIISKEKVLQAFEKHSGAYDKYAFIEHDKDKYDGDGIAKRDEKRNLCYLAKCRDLAFERDLPEDDDSPYGYMENKEIEELAKKYAEDRFPYKKVGDEKEVHIHVLIKFNAARRIDEIARWFGIEPYFIEIVHGLHGFGDVCDYLIHRKHEDKYPYPIEEVHANFNYIEYQDNRIITEQRHEKYHMSVDDLNDVLLKVAKEGLSLTEAIEIVSEPVFLRNESLFKKARMMYLEKYAAMPLVRQVFYVDGDGKGGAGKTVCAKALCKQLALQFGATHEDLTKPFEDLNKYIYKTGDKGVAWQRYDGQPIVFIDDRNAFNMLDEFGGHSGVKNLLDPFPSKASNNIKFGDTLIIAQYIVINGIQPWVQFIEGLCGSYTKKSGEKVESDTDKNQYYRRITGITVLDEDSFEILFNRGVLYDTREYQQYVSIKRTKYNFVKTIQKLKGNALVQIESKALKPMLDEVKKINEKEDGKISDPALIPEEFLSYGEEIIEPKQIDLTAWASANYDDDFPF